MSGSPRPPRAIVFDLDGTLVDSRRDIADALSSALVAHGHQALPFERVLPLIGDGARALVARAIGGGATLDGSSDDADVARVLATFRERYLAKPCVHTKLLPGARAALSVAASAIVTNKPRDIARLVLRALRIEASVAAMWGGDDGPMKPAPDGVQGTLAKLGVAPSDAWMVGDGPQDILAGRAAGCFTIAVPGIAARDRVLEAGPDLVVASLVEVARLASASSL